MLKKLHVETGDLQEQHPLELDPLNGLASMDLADAYCVNEMMGFRFR